ncbi:hypothetical protein [Helicobacter burdigaliensis]|uniref:hypothetical protein n=1 Tax=Helicobacter burdigaliensis TaxID=2315334 RepID=UPI000EF68D11|nr:hypothetical protein [Helicobacter burdigaliensis]
MVKDSRKSSLTEIKGRFHKGSGNINTLTTHESLVIIGDRAFRQIGFNQFRPIPFEVGDEVAIITKKLLFGDTYTICYAKNFTTKQIEAQLFTTPLFTIIIATFLFLISLIAGFSFFITAIIITAVVYFIESSFKKQRKQLAKFVKDLPQNP